MSFPFLSTPSARRATAAPALPCRMVGNFYPRPPRGGRHCPTVEQRFQQVISIHALREEGDHPAKPHPQNHGDFYPRPPRGGRRYHVCGAVGQDHFYPRPPRGGRPGLPCPAVQLVLISIHALREEGDLQAVLVHNVKDISIHALREEGDAGALSAGSGHCISIHALREEGDAFCRVPKSHSREFLSTPSARRATPPSPTRRPRRRNFYPRPPRGGRPSERRAARTPLQISIHALREEGDIAALVQ